MFISVLGFCRIYARSAKKNSSFREPTIITCSMNKSTVSEVKKCTAKSWHDLGNIGTSLLQYMLYQNQWRYHWLLRPRDCEHILTKEHFIRTLLLLEESFEIRAPYVKEASWLDLSSARQLVCYIFQFVYIDFVRVESIFFRRCPVIL